jgi:hypothetical protein
MQTRSLPSRLQWDSTLTPLRSPWARISTFGLSRSAATPIAQYDSAYGAGRCYHRPRWLPHAKKYAIAPVAIGLIEIIPSGLPPSHAIMLLVQIGVRLVAKFIIGVIVGISLGASATAYGADTSRSGTMSGWTAAKNIQGVNISDRPVSVGRASKS